MSIVDLRWSTVDVMGDWKIYGKLDRHHQSIKNSFEIRQSTIDNSADLVTIVRSISPEAKAIYKMRRENLKQISRVLQLQMKSGAADLDSVNEGLIQVYSADGENTIFKSFQQWKEEGKFIIRGSKAFVVWGSPKKTARPEAEEGETDEFKYWPFCYIFSNIQVTEGRHIDSMSMFMSMFSSICILIAFNIDSMSMFMSMLYYILTLAI